MQPSAVGAGMFALSLLCGAHLGEIVRGEVPSTQIDAGRSVGRTFLMLEFYVFAGVFFLIDFANSAARQGGPAPFHATVKRAQAGFALFGGA